MLSKRLLLDIVFDSEDFEHLWIIEENAPSEYRIDFFLNPPEGQSYVNVKVGLYIYMILQKVILNYYLTCGVLKQYSVCRTSSAFVPRY